MLSRRTQTPALQGCTLSGTSPPNPHAHVMVRRAGFHGNTASSGKLTLFLGAADCISYQLLCHKSPEYSAWGLAQVNYLALSFIGQAPAQLCSPKAVVKAGVIRRLGRGRICFGAHAVVGRIQFPKKCGKRATVLCWPLSRAFPQCPTGPPVIRSCLLHQSLQRSKLLPSWEPPSFVI